MERLPDEALGVGRNTPVDCVTRVNLLLLLKGL